MHVAGMLSVLLPDVALTAAVTGRTAGVGAFFVAVPRPPDNSPEVLLPGPPPPLEDTGDGDAIRSGGQLARFAPGWSDAPSLPATTVRRGFHWTWARPSCSSLLFLYPKATGVSGHFGRGHYGRGFLGRKRSLVILVAVITVPVISVVVIFVCILDTNLMLIYDRQIIINY